MRGLFTKATRKLLLKGNPRQKGTTVHADTFCMQTYTAFPTSKITSAPLLLLLPKVITLSLSLSGGQKHPGKSRFS